MDFLKKSLKTFVLIDFKLISQIYKDIVNYVHFFLFNMIIQIHPYIN